MKKIFTENDRKYIQEQIDKGFTDLKLPMYMKEGVENWVFHGIPCGDFLHAVMTNDLKLTVFRADENNLAKTHEWVQFITWNLPSGCQGSIAKVNDWIKRHNEEED